MAKHIHIHFAPRKRIGDQALGSVPPSNLTPLVEALHAAIAARQGTTPTKDADFDESKHKRDADGRFSAQQHEAAAAEHKAEAEKHDAAYKATNDPQHALARNAHQEAGVHHGVAAKHVQAQTGWSAHNAQQAHNATALAKQMSAKTAGSGNLEQLKATASDPKASIEQRAAAVSQLSKMEKMANEVAASPHAVPQTSGQGQEMGPNMQSALQQDIYSHKQGPSYSPKDHPVGSKVSYRYGNEGHKGTGTVLSHGPGGMKVKSDVGENEHLLDARNDPKQIPAESPHAIPTDMDIQAALEKRSPRATLPSTLPEQQGEGKGLDHPGLEDANLKPTSAKATGAKAATHELLSSGHPFSVDELMKATGCSNRTTLMTALSDLKSPKYAGKLGALNIVKRPDGMYHVQKDDGKPLGLLEAPARKMDFNQQGEQNLAPSIAGRKDEGSGTRTPNAPHSGGSTTGTSAPTAARNTTVGGLSRNPVQNVQARMDAKAAAAPKHIPVKSAAWGNPVIPGYTSHKSAVQPKGTHRQAGKEIPASSHEVYHKGQHIGTVQSYSGHRDGPNIGGRVVAWRKDQVQHSFTPKGEAMRELSKHLYPATHFTVGSTSASEAIRRGVEWHQAALARKAQADKAGK